MNWRFVGCYPMAIRMRSGASGSAGSRFATLCTRVMVRPMGSMSPWPCVKRLMALFGSRRQVPKAPSADGSYWRWPVAAMLVMALAIGFGAGAGWDAQSPEPATALEVTEVADQHALAVSARVEEVALQRLDEDQMQQMRQFLLEHAQHNSVGAGRGSVGYARLVSATGGY